MTLMSPSDPADQEDPQPLQEDPDAGPVPPIDVGEWVWEKKAARLNTLDPRWIVPHQVLLATPYCVAVAARGGRKWLHLTQTRRARAPNDRTVADVKRDLAEIGAGDQSPEPHGQGGE